MTGDGYARSYYQRNKPAAKARAAASRAKRKSEGRMKPADAAKEAARRAERKKRSPLYYVLSVAKVRAREKGLEFSITSADVPVPTHCPVLGIPLAPGVGKHHPGSPSIDRIDSAKGYIPGNVWVISYLANARKNDQSPADIVEFGLRLRAALQSRGIFL